MATSSPTIENTLNALLMEIVKGQLSDETISAVDRINPNDVPGPLQEVIKFMHGMTTAEPMRYTVTTMVMRVLAGELFETVEKREKNAPPIAY